MSSKALCVQQGTVMLVLSQLHLGKAGAEKGSSCMHTAVSQHMTADKGMLLFKQRIRKRVAPSQVDFVGGAGRGKCQAAGAHCQYCKTARPSRAGHPGWRWCWSRCNLTRGRPERCRANAEGVRGGRAAEPGKGEASASDPTLTTAGCSG